MMMADSSRSSAVSTAVTTVGDSSSPQGFFSPNDSRYQVSKSIRPVLAWRVPSWP
jgi:hypothetical protein